MIWKILAGLVATIKFLLGGLVIGLLLSSIILSMIGIFAYVLPLKCPPDSVPVPVWGYGMYCLIGEKAK